MVESGERKKEYGIGKNFFTTVEYEHYSGICDHCSFPDQIMYPETAEDLFLYSLEHCGVPPALSFFLFFRIQLF